MSSNQSNSDRRIKSIRRRITSRIIGRKISICFGHDILLFLAILITWLGAAEYVSTGVIDLIGRDRELVYEEPGENDITADGKSVEEFRKFIIEDKSLSIGKKLEYLDDCLIYRVMDKTSKEIYVEIGCLNFAVKLLTAIFSFYIMQTIVHGLSYATESYKVKNILSPLNELAIKADEIARFDFSEDKYHLIEEKITSIEPLDEAKISLGDEDLLGIENAMNSLITRIRESNKQQARFVNDASHELRTPIAVIQGYANMLARWGREDEKVLDESITAIQNESDNMKRLVEQLLFLARGDAGRTMLNKERLNLNALMQEVYEESLMIDENHIYRFQCPEEEVYVMADEGLIKQALRILVDNAAKYTETKDDIILKVGKTEDNKAYLQVQDSGIGMKQVDIEHMFERFYRADEARTFNGTGLGLSIAKWIVDKHEGHFKITSREEIGTRIGIYLNTCD